MVIHWLAPLQENTVESVKSPKLSAGLPSTLRFWVRFWGGAQVRVVVPIDSVTHHSAPFTFSRPAARRCGPYLFEAG
jgi:hypothetical protein